MERSSCLGKFSFSLFRFYLSPIEALYLPGYLGSILRGGLGIALKRMSCVERNKNCDDCILKEKCAYACLFESPRSTEAEVSREASYDPHPFIIEPPLEVKQVYLPQDELLFHLILIGKGISYLPYFILAFEELGRFGIGKMRGKYLLERVESVRNCDSPGEMIYDSQSKTLRGEFQSKDFAKMLKEVEALNPQQVSLLFLTPTRIKHQGRFTTKINFEILLRNLLRRLSWLSELYCGEKWDIDYDGLLSVARDKVHTTYSSLNWYDWERYSRRQNARLKMGGFVGEITFEGELAEFLPFIKLGEYLHIGKGTAYGLGKYKIRGL